MDNVDFVENEPKQVNTDVDNYLLADFDIDNDRFVILWHID